MAATMIASRSQLTSALGHSSRRTCRNQRMPAASAVPQDNGSSSSAPDAPRQAGSTIFYAGQAYTEAEWAKVTSQPQRATMPPPPPTPFVAVPSSQVTALPSFTEVMGFAGSAPEIVNGRLCMLAVVAALGAELATGESVLRQLKDEPTLIVLATTLIIAGSLIPLFGGQAKGQSLGPFTPSAELTNGRTAMLGLAALLTIEAVKGSAFI